jgi:hypothetical protein
LAARFALISVGVMGIIKYRCSESHGEVVTAIVAEGETLTRMQSHLLKLSVWCPYCQTSHEISASEAWVSNVRAA